MRFTFPLLHLSVALLRQRDGYNFFLADAADPGSVVAVPCSDGDIDPVVKKQLICMSDPTTSFCKSVTSESLDLLPNTFVLVADCCGNDVIIGGAGDDRKNRLLLHSAVDDEEGNTDQHHHFHRLLPAKKRTVEALIARYSGDEEGCELAPRCAESSNPNTKSGVEYAILIVLRIKSSDDWEQEVKNKIKEYSAKCTALDGGISLWDVMDPKSCVTQDTLVVVKADVNPLVNKCY